MPSVRFPGFFTVHSSFKRHRTSIDHSRFPQDLSLCSASHSPIGALPTPPMSGSSPSETPRELAQLAGHRRKRSDSPRTTTTTTTSLAAASIPALVDLNVQRYGEQPPRGPRREAPTMQIAPQPLAYLPPLTYGAGPGGPLTYYPPPSDIAVSQQQISPRTTTTTSTTATTAAARKAKAHVASACINCKKKHLRCDNSRPCRRCVQSGKEDTCVDVEHKKRGRPPLKPEDPTVIGRRTTVPTSMSALSGPPSFHPGTDPRVYAPPHYPPILPSAPPSRYGHHRSSSRPSLYGGLQSPYAPPSVAPSTLTAIASGFSYSTRPQHMAPTLVTQQTPSYIPPPSYAVPEAPRQAYGGYPFQPVEGPPAASPYYSNPLFPRDQAHNPPLPSENPYNPGLQLPPIRPSQPPVVDPSVSQHRRATPQTPASTQGQGQSQGREQWRESGERGSKRPKMDIQGILGPKNDE